MKSFLRSSAIVLLVAFSRVANGAEYPQPTESDYVIDDFRFTTGETLSQLRIHYRTLGKPEKDAHGKTRNAVLIMHGTTGSGAQFIRPEFAGELFGPGQPLDATKFFIVLPDGIGHGKSSKPSDGMHAKFPRYGYNDMVEAQYRLLIDGLGVNHARLVMGTSAEMLWFMSSNPVLRQKEAPTLAKTDEMLDKFVADYLKNSDANDVLYAIEASHDYDPGPSLEKIQAPLLAINSADDLINPPELGILEREIKRVPHGRAIVIPMSENTRGHGSHTIAALWKDELAKLLQQSEN